ncbi:GNAT family N-acetyltransferase [Flavobacterium dankookense]|uniref:Acetyltransferase (GNAT) family protein n=1 Tax=Flavobacterium dankookense TaxID=706186 RepID=A0A4R6Q6S5_9FLAO|nr:GNAT family N-acetyltransferase [Flavobacterium dankookense]TDP58204.1 acetyltransferase (GNAT) family protein [Flavobacterium dankookense]
MSLIKEITFQEAFAVRHPVLRKGKPIESCFFKGDDEVSTTHFGIYENDKLVGVASLFNQNHDYFSEQTQIQLRGMAVLESHQKMGLGEKLLSHCESFLKKEKKALLWFNARSSAVPFYEKQDYQKSGDSFEILDIGTHFVMYKKIQL